MVLDRVLSMLGQRVTSNSELGPDTKILADTSFDSVSVMDFVLEIEDEFDVTIPLNRLAEVETIGQLAEAVTRLRNGR